MKAAIFYKPHDVRIEEIPIPNLCDHGGLLLKVNACGLCGSDLRTLQFGHPKVHPPFILGHEISGEVVEIAPGVTSDFQVGSRLAIAPLVFCGQCNYCQAGYFQFCEHYREIGQSWPGGFEQFMIIPAESLSNGVIHEIPVFMDPAHAVLSEPLSACLNAIDFVDFRLVRSAAIFGAGTIGCLLLQLLQMKSLEHITLIDPNETRLRIAEKFNPNRIINISEINTSIEKVIGNQRFDLIFTATAAPIVQNQALHILEKGGQVVVFSGLPKEHSEIAIDYNLIHYRNLRIIGSSIYSKKHHENALSLIAEGKMKVEELITRYPLIHFNQSSNDALAGRIIKAVLIP